MEAGRNCRCFKKHVDVCDVNENSSGKVLSNRSWQEVKYYIYNYNISQKKMPK